MAAARALLKADVRVLLIEAGSKIGGNCFGVDVKRTDGKIERIDAGVSDFNRATFIEVGKLVKELDLQVAPIMQDASFMNRKRETVWSSRDGVPNYGPLIEDSATLHQEQKRFRSKCIEVLGNPRYEGMTAAQYLALEGYSEAFFHNVFGPRAAGCFAMPADSPGSFSIQSIVAFWRIHGIVGPGPADRVCIVGGMHRYVDAFAQWFMDAGGALYTSARVIGVRRRAKTVEIRTLSRDDDYATFHVDQVLFACNAADVVPMLEDATSEERSILATFPFQRARLVVHHDERVMPADRNEWGAFNYIIGDGNEIGPTITFYQNRMNNLPPEVPDTFVTMNPIISPDPSKVLLDRYFLHPLGDGRTLELAARVEAMQGRDRFWYAGAHLLAPWVHEPAMVTGIQAAERMLMHEHHRTRIAQPARAVSDVLEFSVGQTMFVADSADAISFSRLVAITAVDDVSLTLTISDEDIPTRHMFLAMQDDALRSIRVFRCHVIGHDVEHGTVEVVLPQEVSRIPRRSFVRANMVLQGTLTQGRRSFPIKTRDIGAGGASVTLLIEKTVDEVIELKIGTVCYLSLLFPHRAAPMEVTAEVVRHQTVDEGSAIALIFTEINELDRMQLEIDALRATTRHHTRIVVRIPCTLATPNAPTAGWIEDLSAGGALVTLSNNAPLLGTLLAIDFALPDRTEISVQARVVRVANQDARIRVGLEFANMPDADATRLASFTLLIKRNSERRRPRGDTSPFDPSALG